jgi:peptide/nickel transport system permease protein
MIRFLLRRAIQVPIVLLGVSVLAFGMLHLSGDPVHYMLGSDATQDQIERLQAEFGLDRPLYAQLGQFLRQLALGNLGVSIRFRQPALALVLDRLPATLTLTFAAMAIAVVTAIPLGVLAAMRQGTAYDHALMGSTLVNQAMPSFWLGIMLILVFPVKLGVLYTGGWSGPRDLGHLILPSLTLASFISARLIRLVRSSVTDTLRQEYMRTAEAKGLSARRTVLKHGLRNALIPITTLVGMDLGLLLGGATVTETIFAYPGIGQLALQSVIARDYPIVQATVLVVAALYSAVTLMVDATYVVLDPRVRGG